MPVVYSHFRNCLELVVTELKIYLSTKHIDLRPYIEQKSGLCAIYLTKGDGTILRKSNMCLTTSDEKFCEYLLRHLEAVIRDKSGYSWVKYPQIPEYNEDSLIHYDNPNGDEEYYRLVDKRQQPRLIRKDKHIFAVTQAIISDVVKNYFDRNPEAIHDIANIFAPKANTDKPDNACHSKALLSEEEQLSYEGIDASQNVTAASLDEARRVLLENQNILIVEDIQEEHLVKENETREIVFTSMEISLLKILLHSQHVEAELHNMMKNNVIPSVIIDCINEKAMDIVGDVFIERESDPPYIFDEYTDMCEEVIAKYE